MSSEYQLIVLPPLLLNPSLHSSDLSSSTSPFLLLLFPFTLCSNKQLVNVIKALAEKKSCTAAQIALAWILAQDISVLPIPGTRRVKYLEENVASASIELTKEEVEELNEYINKFTPKGLRYDHPMIVAF